MRRIGIPLLFISVVLLLCFFAVAITPWAQSPAKPNLAIVQPLVLYDNFNGARIDPAKWNDWMASANMREAVRELSPPYQGQGNNGRLRLFQRAYSDTYNDVDAGYGALGLQFTHPSSVVEVSFDVAVNSATASGCQSNPTVDTSVWASFEGRFFSTDGSQDGNQDGTAEVDIVRDSRDSGASLTVRVVIGGPGGYYDSRTLGFVSPGQTTKLHFKWDQPNHQFIVQLNADPAVSIGYNLTDTFSPALPLKAFAVTYGIPHCTTAPLGSAMMDAYFDKVYVNAH